MAGVLPVTFAFVLTAAPMPASSETPSFTADFNADDAARWVRSDGYTNGGSFNVGWRADHVEFVANDPPSDGVMRLRLDNVPSSGKPYSSGEYRTRDLISYGTVCARMKPARGSGVISSLFMYDPSDEIDIEFMGKDTTKVLLNYFTNGVGGHETLIDLGFDASMGFHYYGFSWSPSAITWYVDGKVVHRETGTRGPLPTKPGRIYMNLWTGNKSAARWLGRFRYTGPLRASYDNVSFTTSDTGCPPRP